MEEDKTKFQLAYLVMPDYVYKDNRLTDVARRVYCFIHSYKSEKGFFFSNENLGEMFNCHPQTITKAISLLLKLEYIKTSFTIKAGGGKKRIILDAYSDYAKKVSPTNPTGSLLYIKDNNKNIISKDIIQVKPVLTDNFGNKEINLILTLYQKSIGFSPTDKQPRRVAQNIRVMVHKFIKNYRPDSTFEDMMDKLFAWYLNRYEPEVRGETLDVFKRKIKIPIGKASQPPPNRGGEEVYAKPT